MLISGRFIPTELKILRMFAFKSQITQVNCVGDPLSTTDNNHEFKDHDNNMCLAMNMTVIAPSTSEKLIHLIQPRLLVRSLNMKTPWLARRVDSTIFVLLATPLFVLKHNISQQLPWVPCMGHGIMMLNICNCATSYLQTATISNWTRNSTWKPPRLLTNVMSV